MEGNPGLLLTMFLLLGLQTQDPVHWTMPWWVIPCQGNPINSSFPLKGPVDRLRLIHLWFLPVLKLRLAGNRHSESRKDAWPSRSINFRWFCRYLMHWIFPGFYHFQIPYSSPVVYAMIDLWCLCFIAHLRMVTVQIVRQWGKTFQLCRWIFYNAWTFDFHGAGEKLNTRYIWEIPSKFFPDYPRIQLIWFLLILPMGFQRRKGFHGHSASMWHFRNHGICSPKTIFINSIFNG